MLTRAARPYADTLAKVGIDAKVRDFEVPNYLYQVRTRNFDATMQVIIPPEQPGFYLQAVFGSAAAADYGFNYAGIRSPVVDHLIQRVIDAQSERQLLAVIRALDRVLLWNLYFVPGMARPGYRLTYWDEFGQLSHHGRLRRSVFFDAWWHDEAKAARVAAGLAERRASE